MSHPPASPGLGSFSLGALEAKAIPVVVGLEVGGVVLGRSWKYLSRDFVPRCE